MATRSAQSGWPHPVDEQIPHQDFSNMLATSPPSKQALRSWWGKFKKTSEGKPTMTEMPDRSPGIFGIPLRESISYANVAISLVDAEGKSYIYGYVPIIVAKCGVYLKEKATNVEGIFRLSGAEKRIKELKATFDTPPRYGKGLDWDGYTVHDAANVLRRYLNQLPEPIVPFDLYERFRSPLRAFAMNGLTFDLAQTIKKYQKLITELPPLNIQLLLYILDLLAVFASKADENRMTAENLAAIFQPCLLRHPLHDMAPAEYKLSQDVIIFLINNQDHFLIGMRGTAADEKTVQEVQNGTPPSSAPSTPKMDRRQGSLGRSASIASAGGDSLRRNAGLRRNVSINSRHSRQSNGAPSPASPAYGSANSFASGSGVYRSNTVPSKKSPGLSSTRMQKFPEMRSASGSAFPQALTPLTPLTPNTPGSSALASTGLGAEPPTYFAEARPLGSALSDTPESPPLQQLHTLKPSEPSQEHLIESPENTMNVGGRGREKEKERGFASLFGRSPSNDTDKKPPNKLRKKRIPGSTNPSAQSSATSLENTSYDMPEPTVLETIPSMNHLSDINPGVSYTEPTPPLSHDPDEPILSDTGLHIAMRPGNTQHSSEGTLKPKTSSNSLKSGYISATDQSDMEAIDDPIIAAEQKEKRRRWRLSRTRHDSSTTMHTSSPKKSQATESKTSFATTSSNTRKSVSTEPEPGSLSHTSFTGITGTSDGSEKEKKGPIGWIKDKMREVKEEKRARDLEKEHVSIATQESGGGIPKQLNDMATPDAVLFSNKRSTEIRREQSELRKTTDHTSHVTSEPERPEDPTLAADIVTAQPHMVQILEEADPIPKLNQTQQTHRP